MWNGCSGLVFVTFFKHLLVFSVFCLILTVCPCLSSSSFLLELDSKSLFIFLLSSLAPIFLFLNHWKIAQVWTGVCGVLSISSEFWAMSYFLLYWKIVFSNCWNVFRPLKLCHLFFFKEKKFKFWSFLRQQGPFWMFCCHRLVLHLKTLRMCKIFIMMVTQLHRSHLLLDLFPFEWLFSPQRWSTEPQHHHSEPVKAWTPSSCLSVLHLPHFLPLSAHLTLYPHFATFLPRFLKTFTLPLSLIGWSLH